MGYWIRTDYAGRGLAGEAARHLTRIGLELQGISRIEVHCHPASLASQGIPERLGYRLVNSQSSSGSADTEVTDKLVFVFTPDLLHLLHDPGGGAGPGEG